MFMIRRFPFDTKSLVGYSFAAIIQYIYVNNMLIVIKCMTIIGTATLLTMFTILNDMNGDLNVIDAISSKNKRMAFQMGEKLYQFIQFHSDAIQLSFIFFTFNPNCEKSPFYNFSRLARDLSKIWEAIFRALFLYIIAGICNLLLMIKMEMVV